MVPFELVEHFFYNGEDAITGRGGNSFAETGGFTPGPLRGRRGFGLFRKPVEKKVFLDSGKIA